MLQWTRQTDQVCPLSNVQSRGGTTFIPKELTLISGWLISMCLYQFSEILCLEFQPHILLHGHVLLAPQTQHAMGQTYSSSPHLFSPDFSVLSVVWSFPNHQSQSLREPQLLPLLQSQYIAQLCLFFFLLDKCFWHPSFPFLAHCHVLRSDPHFKPGPLHLLTVIYHIFSIHFLLQSTSYHCLINLRVVSESTVGVM